MTGHSKIRFICRVSPISTMLFCCITCIVKRLSLRLFRFKISQVSPFAWKHLKIRQKGTNCKISNLKNRRWLEIHVIEQVLYRWGKPYTLSLTIMFSGFFSGAFIIYYSSCFSEKTWVSPKKFYWLINYSSVPQTIVWNIIKTISQYLYTKGILSLY